MQPWEQTPEDVFEERADDPGIALCPSCLNETRPNAHFCHTCVCPLTWYAGTGPLEQVWAWPWIVWRAGRTKWPRSLHAWGATLVFLPEFLSVIAVVLFAWLWPEVVDWPGLFTAAREGEGEWWDMAMLAGGLLLGLLQFILTLALAMRAWVNWLDRKDLDPWGEEPSDAGAGM